jgi:exonuclease SbcD
MTTWTCWNEWVVREFITILTRKKVIPIKIAHVSDVHQGWNYPGPTPFSRFEDINRILTWTADKIIGENCDLCLICGDAFKDAKVMLDRASREIASIVKFLRRLSEEGIEVIVISGTPSHDAIAAYDLIGQMNIMHTTICTKPEILGHSTSSYYIACLPGLNRSALMTQDEYKGLPTEQVHRLMTDKITQICIGMAAQMPQDKPKILMAHMTYQGADTGFTDLLMQHEPILTKEAVAGFDLVCLGHIHRPQVIDGKVFYSGPIERLSFNEEDITPGFWIHDYEPDLPYDNFHSQFIETPARRYSSFFWNEETVQQFLKGEHEPVNPCIDDAIVRLRYSCSEEVAKQVNRKQLEQALYDAGCYFCQEIKADVTREDRARDATVSESLSVEQALGKWCANQGIPESEIAVLQSMTGELLEGGM